MGTSPAFFEGKSECRVRVFLESGFCTGPSPGFAVCQVNVPTHQANASTNHAYVPSGHVNDVPISQLHHPTSENRHTETELEQLQPHMPGNVINPPAYQQIPNMQIAQLLAQQQQHTLALTLPTPKVPTFSGNPIDFHGFIQAFEQLIEQKTSDDSARLYYLIHREMFRN